MASNPFLTSPFSLSETQSKPVSANDFEDTPEKATAAAPAKRGIAPTKQDLIARAKQLGVNPDLALSFFTQESSGNWNSKDSPKGARGGMQVMPGTYRSMMGTEAGQNDPWNNMEAGLRYIAYGQKRLKTTDPELLAAGYHAGYDHPSLRKGVIPGTNDGMISTRDYAKSVTARLGKRSSVSLDDQFSDTPEGAITPAESDFVDSLEEATATPVIGAVGDAQTPVEDRSYLDRLTEETKAGFGDMTRSLETARWALGGGDTNTIAEQMAQSFQEQAKKPKTAAQQEIDAAYKGVNDAQGVVDTTVAGAKALFTSITNPKETSIEIARNAANSLPTLAAGAAGAAGGAAVGSVVPVVGTTAGAIAGGRAGMVAGTTATELGAEIQDMVQKRLADNKQPPTAQNILAILNDKAFQEAALKQGTLKGLTVAAVDQLFMGLGGKIATAPTRKIAVRELAEQGMDMATRTARKEALASAAGQAAMQAAKPSIGARAAAGAAAVAVDAAGESIGEGLSQKVARGEVDYGDALREGVVSIGQSVAQTAVGATIETAKQAAASARGGITPDAKAPSEASGPLARAAENAAVEPERVTVTAPDGQVTGTVTGQSENGVQIVGDDGQVYNFKTGPNGVTITPEAPNAPLSNALEVAAEEVAPAAPEPVAAPEAVAPAPEPVVPQAPITEAARPAEPAQEKTLADMTDDELRARLKYIADQAKPANGGWTKLLVDQRRLVEREINARAPKVETPVEQPTVKESLQVAPAEPVEQAPAKLPKELAGAKERFNYGKKGFELKFDSDIDRAAFISSLSRPDGKRSAKDADYLNFAMQATGMTEAEVRAHGQAVKDAIKGMAKDASPGTLKVPEVARGSVAVASDVSLTNEGKTEPVSQPAPIVGTTEEGAGASQPTQAATETSFKVGDVVRIDGKDGTHTVESISASGYVNLSSGYGIPPALVGEMLSRVKEAAKPEKPTKASKEDLEHLFGTDKKRATALKRIESGTAFFGSKEKAEDFIKKNGLKDTHTVEQTGKVRFEVKAKQLEAQIQDFIDGKRETPPEVPTQEPVNVADQRAEREPAGAEAVGQEANAGPAQAAPVQSAASEKVTPESEGRKAFAEGKERSAPQSLSFTGKKKWLSGWDAANAAAPMAEQRYTDFTRNGITITVAKIKGAENEYGVSYASTNVATATSKAEADAIAQRVLDSGANNIQAMREAARSDDGQNDELDAEMRSYESKAELAPGTRINGKAERAAADRLEKLHEQMGNITQRNSREGSAKAAVRSVIEELRKPKTVVSIVPVLDGAANGLDKNYSAFADVIREVADSLNGEKEKPAAQPKTDASLFAGNKLFTADAVEKARARLKSKLGQLNSGIDPEVVIDGMTLAGAYIEAGVRSFSAYAKAMIADIGDEVKPYLLSFYEAARNYPGLDTEGMTPVAEAKAEFDALSASTDNQQAEGNQGNDNGPQELDQSGPRELEGKQPDALQGAQPDGQTRAGSEGGSRADASGDVGTGGSRVQQSGSLGDDAGAVSTLAARRNAGRNRKQGSSSVQGSDSPAKQDPASGERGNQPELIPESGTRAQDRADGFVITEQDGIGEGGAKTKFKQNVAAIRLLKQLTAENRQATRAEQAVLAKYVGWGGIPQAFYRDNGEVSKGWEKEAAELKELMTEDELAAAASSTRNAHYTSPEIVSAVWDAAKHFGFQGGRVLEPSVGVGNFFGLMPTALRSASQLTGVELDHITGGIAKQLYPLANIQAPVGFQDFSAPDNYFELAIGNPPFGREGIYDAVRRKISGFSIHNYFFAKSIDTVRPNGVLAMVVTNRLLDSVGDKARQYIADRAEFLGAIRLPNDAFLKNAGTQVTTDIIFLRKLKDGEQPMGQRWMDVKQVTDKNGKTVPLNEYFVRNPEMMLGEFGAYGSMYSPDDAALVARPGQDTPALLREAIAKLPAGFMDAPTHEPSHEGIEPMHDVSHVKIGSVFEQGGQIYERREDMLGKQQAALVTFPNEKAKERVSGMIKVRDALISVRRLQLTDGVSDKALEEARAGLNKAYDTFVKANGPINADANKRLMRDDPTWPQLAALEDGFDKGISAAVAKNTGEKARPASARKSAIFFKRTQSPYHAPTKANSAKDALVTSLAERGRVDLDYMAGLYGKTPDAIVRELEGLIYKNPAAGWESRDQYLSGNVKKKLAQAIEAAQTDPSFKANVDALREVQPADIEAVDIDVKVGAHWVPADVMQTFVEHITEGQKAKAIYNPVNAKWTLDAERVPQSAMTQWGTDRVNVLGILEAAANAKQVTVYDQHRDGSRTLNEAATTAANEKVERVKAEWKNWIWGDDARRERLHRIYNDTFNTDVQRDFDGSHLTFPGKVGDEIIQLRPHQSNAVWRMVQSGTTLLDHVVGAGKTFTMIAGIMEMRRMGMAKKPMLVVPNHLVGQWAEDFMKLYPGANILAATKKDFEKDNRKKLFARIATGDWDAVIVAHSSFGKVEVEPEFQEQFIKQQIADMDLSIAAMRVAEGKGSRNVKQIEKQKAALEEKLKRLFDTGSKDDNLYFGELGVDALLLDEAHEFKNLGFSTSMQRVAGLGNPAGSNKASDMFMKVQAVLKRTGGRNVVFATGTPISNTMAEMYTMQRYLDYGTLKDQGIAHFDAWAKTFGEVVTDWELSPSGQYKMNSRFAKFVNMPELMQRYQSFADVINRDDINRMLAAQGKKLPVPKVKSGKPENIVVERSALQAAYIGIPKVDENGVEQYPQGSLVWRAENLPKKAEKGADNMLKIMSDARKAALDMRLINPSYPDNPGSKVNVAAQNIRTIYDQWDKDKGTQLVFIDLSTPKGAVAKEAAALRELVKLAEDGDEAAQEKLDAMSPDELLALDSDFSVYDDLKAKLIGLGIPEKEIAFIHDANTEIQKDELFAKVRSGRVRVLFGSTAKMGAGMNVQERLVALHHLDAPWRPSDLEQREGRIIRQGNKLYEADPENFEVQIQRYATKQTLDSRMWQTIEAKARFIEQVRKGAGNEREVEDVAGEAANSAEMKAASSGNPLILEEMSLRQAIRKLENSQSEHNREQYRIRDRMRLAADASKHYDREAAVMEADAPKAPKEFSVKIGKQTFDKHGEAGEAILKAVDAMLAAGEDSREIGTYGGFKLTVDDVTIFGGTKKAVVTVKGAGEYQVEANPGSAATGLALRLQNTVKGLAAEAERARAMAQRNRDDIPKLEAQIKPWGQVEELAEAKVRHAAVIEQLKPKKKEQPQAQDGAPAMSRTGLEEVFEALEGRGLTRKRALDALADNPNAETIQYIDQNFWEILGELEDKRLVDIKC